MARLARPGAASSTLFSQLAVRLGLLAIIFGVLNVLIVIASYALDQQEMAGDFIGGQATRLERVWREGGRDTIPAPMGVTRWGYSLLDPQGRTLMSSAIGAPRSVAPDLIEETRRTWTGGHLRISGARRLEHGGWALLWAETSGFSVYLPAIGGELLDHVALPFLPLTGLLLAFNIIVVRRLLTPLRKAAAEADGLDAKSETLRLTEPEGPKEVAALVAAVNGALERLRKALGLLKAFTADAAHELRTPLAVLKLRVGQLPHTPVKDEIRADLNTMTRLVNQMLDLSQADALQMEGAEFLNLSDIATQVIAQTAPLAFSEDVDLRFVDRSPAPIRGHADAIGRALRNLIENAVRHGRGAGPVEITVGPGPLICVRDHGPGLADADLEFLFQRFWRSRRDQAEGAGLGLGIVKSIVEAHGGSVSAGNAEGGGAEFILAFPDATAFPGLEVRLG